MLVVVEATQHVAREAADDLAACASRLDEAGGAQAAQVETSGCERSTCRMRSVTSPRPWASRWTSRRRVWIGQGSGTTATLEEVGGGDVRWVAIVERMRAGLGMVQVGLLV